MSEIDVDFIWRLNNPAIRKPVFTAANYFPRDIVEIVGRNVDLNLLLGRGFGVRADSREHMWSGFIRVGLCAFQHLCFQGSANSLFIFVETLCTDTKRADDSLGNPRCGYFFWVDAESQAHKDFFFL